MIFIEKGVTMPINIKYGIIITIILFALIWSLWMNSVTNNILDIQSKMIEHKDSEICRLYDHIENLTGKELVCYLSRAPEFKG